MDDLNLDPVTSFDSDSDKLAREILLLTRDSLLVALRFMGVALCHLTYVPTSDKPLATDGQQFYYNAQYTLNRYRSSREQFARDYLHLVLHCLFYHPFSTQYVRPDCRNLACDIAVENIISEACLHQTACASDVEQQPVIRQLKKSLKAMTAERIYQYLLDQAISEETIAHWRILFFRDDHSCWHQMPDLDEADRDGDQAGSEPQRGEGMSPTSQQSAYEQWQTISERVQVDLDTVSRHWADRSESLTGNIHAVNRERFDYGDFLNRFMVQGEAIQVNDDEFDYVYYNYGLQLYRNMPLIEPLEYKDVLKLRDFVIAIDTSGSCSGDLVQRFISITCAIFERSESFFQSFNIHIIQCDTKIQSAVKLTRLEDFSCYLKTVKLTGFGGTDFRPVFRYVDEMIANKEFTNLKGLIYFTDGLGIFPEQKPSYETAFIFLSDEGHQLTTPPWAIKLVLTEEDLARL